MFGGEPRLLPRNLSNMASIPKRVEDRLAAGVKKYQPVLALAKSRDVNESDTVAILNDILGDVFGYAKYFEITSEFSIRGTYCDLASFNSPPIALASINTVTLLSSLMAFASVRHILAESTRHPPGWGLNRQSLERTPAPSGRTFHPQLRLHKQDRERRPVPRRVAWHAPPREL
jgi:hypothetical protein